MEVAQHEGIEVNEEDIAQRIKQISEQTGQSIEQITKYIQDNNLTASLKDELRSNKTIEFLLKEAKIDEK